MKVGTVRAHGLRCGKARWVDREVGRLEGREVGQMEGHGTQQWTQGGSSPSTGRTSAARTAAPLLRDLEQAGQGRAGLPHTADLAGLQETYA